MKTETIPYAADGLEMIGHLTWDETASGPRPGVLVFPEAFGLGEHAKGRAEQITSEVGYVALASDLHGGGQVFTDLGQVMPLLQPLRTDAAKAAVGFHSGLKVTSPGDAKQIKAKVLALLGAGDPAIPPEQRMDFEAMLREGGVDWQMTLYGGVVHSFTNPQANQLGRPDLARYDAKAEARSRKQTSDLLGEVFR
jgi:dienelactone hydrolase